MYCPEYQSLGAYILRFYPQMQFAPHHDRLIELLTGVERGEIKRVIVSMAPRHGKEVAHSTPVFTTKGWTTHGELKPGDYVFHPSGQPVKVLNIQSEQHFDDYVVCFSNGERIRCHENHEWVVVVDKKREMTFETKELFSRKLWRGEKGKRGCKMIHQVRNCNPLELEEKELPIDPYVFGCWLGDGTSESGTITYDRRSKAHIDKISSICEMGATWPHPDKEFCPNNDHVTIKGIRAIMRSLGILGNKHIPECYLRASKRQRIELLAGLIDTDGSVDEHGRVRYGTTSEKIRDGIVDLLTGLALRPYVMEQEPHLTTSGIQGKLKVYSIGFQPTFDIPTARPEKKTFRIIEQRRIAITDIIYSPNGEMGRCIQVDSPDGLYLVGKTLIPTHNSLIVSEHFPAWYLGRNPSKQIAVATYGQTLSEKFGRKVKAQVMSEQWEAIFPHSHIRDDACSSRMIETKTRGVYLATSIGGALTGSGADLLIIDDPVKDRQDAESETMRESTWDWYVSTARTRIMPGGAIVVVQTRWHEDDLAGRILASDKEGEWEVFNLPAIDDGGQALWPEWYPIETLLSIRRDIGGYEFEALYQGNPRPREGNVLPVSQLRYYREEPSFSRVIQIWDTAIKEKKQNDWSVCETLGIADGNIYEIDQWRGKVAYPGLKQMVGACYDKHKPSLVVIEDKASGQQLIQELSATMPIKAAKAVTDKVERAGTLADIMSVGRLYLKAEEERNNKTVSEMAAFPNGTNDDIVDAFAYGARELIRSEILPLIGDLFNPEEHVLKHTGWPHHLWSKLRSMHYDPFGQSACIWWTVADSRADYAGRSWEDGDIIVLAAMQWDKGSTPEEMADRIKAMESKLGMGIITPGPAGAGGQGELRPPEGPGAITAMAKRGLNFIRAIEDEPEGWAQMRSRLYDGSLKILEGCTDLIQQIQHATADPKKKDQAEAGQHIPALQALRYVCRAFRRQPKKTKVEVKAEAWRKEIFRR